MYKAASSNVFAHFCSDYFDNETCQNKAVRTKNFEGGFRDLEDFKETVSGTICKWYECLF